MNSECHESPPESQADVMRCRDSDIEALRGLLDHYGLQLHAVSEGQAIPGSFWGDEEAGLLANRLLVRPDTPLHSLLHEACHFVCMDSGRRGGLHTNAGGDYDEENAVCYLSILLADQIPGFGRERMLRDMDAWGYSFRLGSAAAWFIEDADDARSWLLRAGLITVADEPTFALRV